MSIFYYLKSINMKRKFIYRLVQIVITYTTIFLLNVTIMMAQAPLAVPYQAVARNSSGNIIANQTITLRFSIHDITIGGTIVYRETQSVVTNTLGLFTVNIGQGTSLIGTLAGINWSNGTKFIQVELDASGGTSFIDMGTTQLMSVPYALYSSSSSDNRWGMTSNNIYSLNSGNVGIGISNPVSKLHIKHPAINTTGIQLDSYTGLSPIFTAWQGGSGNGNISLFDSAGIENFKISTSLSANSWLNCANVGIGTSTPTAKLEVNGNLIAGKSNLLEGSIQVNQFGTGNRNSYIDLIGDDTYTDYGLRLIRENAGPNAWSKLWHRGTGPLYIGSQESAPIILATGTLDRLNITPNGNIGIGTTAPTPSAKLEISSTTQGFLPPRMSMAERNAIIGPAMGLIICCTNCSSVPEIEMYNGTTWTSLKGVTAGSTIVSDTAIICGQVWMKKNLNVDKYRNGDPIPRVDGGWNNVSYGAYCYYNNDSASYAATYGKLYNWHAVNDPRGLAPIGWHIPTLVEWTWLENCLGGSMIAGNKLKEDGTTHWLTSPTGVTNSSKFTALPCGQRTQNGIFTDVGAYGWFWLNTLSVNGNPECKFLTHNTEVVSGGSVDNNCGFSVRCLQD
jgi:uncharacterized protein (TIGR02145 family)